MSGYTARTGFQFQDRYLLLRVLRAAARCLDVEWSHGGNDALKALVALPLRFGLEATPQHDAVAQSQDISALDWDVLVSDQKRLEFAEVKSGTISKQDRLSFWRRLRRELTRAETSPPNVVPVLVVDPSTAGELTKWQALASTAAAFVGQAPKTEPTGNVTTAHQLFEEALWSLCCPDNSTDESDPSVDLNIAKTAISAFELHCHKSAELEAEVEQYLETLFPGGLDVRKAVGRMR